MLVFNVLSLLSALLLIAHIFAKVRMGNNEAMAFAEVRESQTRSPKEDPTTISVQVTAFGETQSLELVPRDGPVFTSDFQGFVADADQKGRTVLKKIVATRTAQDDLHSKLYTDKTGSASLCVERFNGHIALEGMLDHETRIANDLNRMVRSLTDPVNHVVFKRMAKPEAKGFCRALVPNITDKEKKVDLKDPHVATRELPSQVFVETLLVIDLKTTTSFKFDLNEIKKYIGIFFNAVNRRYSCSGTPQISFVITGIILTTANTAQPFLRYNTKTPSQLDAEETLYAFGEWMATQRASLTTTSYNIATWITGMEFASDIVGIAFVAGACWLTDDMNINVALVRDQNYNGVHTMTHELAHLLGSAHDGEIVNIPKGNPGAKSCLWSSGYIMSYEFGTANTFHFSTCSCNQMKYTLDSGRVNCLLNAPQQTFVPLNSTLPGTVVSLDAQCKSKFGQDFVFYENKLKEVCVKMWCIPAKYFGFFVKMYTRGPALEGSRCGKNKVCLKGCCV